MRTVKNAVVWITTILFYTHTLIVSAGESYWIPPTPSAEVQGTWAEHATETKNGILQGWIPMHKVTQRDGVQTVVLPKDSYQIVARATWNRDRKDFDWNMIDGPEWVTRNRPEIGQAGGLPNGAVMSDWIRQQAGGAPMVFAAYSPQTLELRIAVQAVEKLPNGDIIVKVMDYTPHHGRWWIWGGKFRTAAEQAYDPDGLGYNPFAAFAGADDDPVFHNCSWSCAVTATGLAIMHQRALFGWIATTQTRQDVRTSSSGNVFRKTVKTEVSVYAKPHWWIAGPVEMVPGGQHHSICVGPEAVADPTAGCMDEARIANSGVLVSEWVGGDIPVSEDLVYKWVNKQSSFTVLFYTVLTFLAVAGAGLLMAGQAGMAGAGAGGSAGAGGGSLGSLGAGVLAGGAYAMVSTEMFQDGGLTSAQEGYLDDIDSGWADQPNPTGKHEARIAQGITNKAILPSVQSGESLTAVAQLFGTDCPLNLSVEECEAQGKDPGMGWRTDSYMQHREVLLLRDQYRRCAAAGYTGATLAQCAAPGRPDLLSTIPQ